MIVFFIIIVLFVIGTTSILISIFFESDQNEYIYQSKNILVDTHYETERPKQRTEPELQETPVETQINEYDHDYSYDDDQDLIIYDDFDQEKIIIDDL